jgi:hypothetical protein
MPWSVPTSARAFAICNVGSAGCSVMATIHGFVKDPDGQFVALASGARER